MNVVDNLLDDAGEDGRMVEHGKSMDTTHGTGVRIAPRARLHFDVKSISNHIKDP